MDRPDTDPFAAPEGVPLRPEDGPQLLPTVDPRSLLGRQLRQSLERMRSESTDPAIRRAVQDTLDGKLSARDLIRVPAIRRAMDEAGRRLRVEFAQMSSEERDAVRDRLRGPGSADGTGLGGRS